MTDSNCPRQSLWRTYGRLGGPAPVPEPAAAARPEPRPVVARPGPASHCTWRQLQSAWPAPASPRQSATRVVV